MRQRSTRHLGKRADESVPDNHSPKSDQWLLYAVLVLFILILSVVLYGVFIGTVSPPAPRTATEARINVLESVLQESGDSGKAHFDYATGLAAAGNTRKAYQAVADAREVLTGWEIAFADAAESALLFGEGKYAETREVARAGYERDMKEREKYVKDMKKRNMNAEVTDYNVEPLVTMLIFEGRAAGAMEDWDAAIQAFTDALALSARSSDILVLRAAAYEESGDEAAALADYQDALMFIPDFEPALAGVERLGAGD